LEIESAIEKQEFFHSFQSPCNVSLVFQREKGIMKRQIITIHDQLVWKSGCVLCWACQYTNLHPM